MNNGFSSPSGWSPSSAKLIAGICVAGVVCIVLFAVLVFCTLRRHKTKNHDKSGGRANVDVNPIYGLYECDPDPQAEVQDTNDYYDAMYEDSYLIFVADAADDIRGEFFSDIKIF